MLFAPLNHQYTFILNRSMTLGVTRPCRKAGIQEIVISIGFTWLAFVILWVMIVGVGYFTVVCSMVSFAASLALNKNLR